MSKRVAGCTYVLRDGTRIELFHHPDRVKPIIQVRQVDGNGGYAVFHDEDAMEAFIRLLDRILRPKET